MNGFETVTRNCPECGAEITVTELPGYRIDPLTKKKKRRLACTKCDWSTII